MKFQKHSIQVTFSIVAKDEQEAEHKVHAFLRDADMMIKDPDVVDWEFTEFVPTDCTSHCDC